MQKLIKYLAAIFIILSALVIYSSFLNMNKYYINATDGAVKIWKGKFAPMSKELFIILPGAQDPQSIKDVYLKEEAFPLIFNYYVNKADALLDLPGMPDFEGIKFYLNKAIAFGTTDTLLKKAHTRLNSIDMMILQYKADVAASKETIDGFKTALDYLETAALLDLDDSQKKIIKQKIEYVKTQISDSITSPKKNQPSVSPVK